MEGKSIKLVAFSIIVFFGAQGCNRDSIDRTTTAATDNAIAQSSFDDIYALVLQEAADAGFAGLITDNNDHKTTAGCAIITFSATLGEFPNTITIDYGSGCVTLYGATRMGKIIATFTGAYKNEGTVISISTDEYRFDGNQIEGTKTITNLGENAAGNLNFSIFVVDGKITTLSEAIIEWESSRNREWLEGDSTFDILDDKYAITGTSNGINRDGVVFNETITTQLIKEMGCRYIVSGVREIEPYGLETRIIDYGDGTCDQLITLTIGDFETEIELPL